MNIPFSVEDFMNIFRIYNRAFFFMPIVMYILGLVSVSLVIFRSPVSNRIICGILSFFWIWMGAVYHIIYFSTINQASVLFGILFILQGLVFLLYGTVKNRLVFQPVRNFQAATGSIFILYALIVYPLLGKVMGHVYPASPIFGMAPCPTTIFTFGMLIVFGGRVPLFIYLVPFLWAIIGLSAALNLGIYEDIGLTISGLLGVLILIRRNRILRNSTTVIKI